MAERNISELLALNTVAGDLGIEIEVEGGSYFPENDDIPSSLNWRAEADGSLRGYSMEYIIRKPIKHDEVERHLEALKGLWDAHKCTPKYSFRAGVHVHVNVQRMTINQLLTFACLYYCLEHALVKFCGSNREGNLFCLRVEDAEYTLVALENAVVSSDLHQLGTDNIRYSSLNLRAIPQYGSVEFRAMETQPDLSKIKEWCAMLIAIRDAAIATTNRREIPYDLSFKGPEQWASDILGADLFKLIAYENINRDIMRGMRMCQHLFYREV